ncbi:MAG: hypothetical protein WD229_01710 [Pirellulales bacterium]
MAADSINLLQIGLRRLSAARPALAKKVFQTTSLTLPTPLLGLFLLA